MNNMTSNEKNMAMAMTSDVIASEKEVNNTLTITGEVSPMYMTHYTSPLTGVLGIIHLVKDILRTNDAVFSKNAHKGELRQVVIFNSMTMQDILTEVQKIFTMGTKRYPIQTIKNVLSTYAAGDIQKITGTNDPGASDDRYFDNPRPCAKPRARYYLVLKQD